MATTPHDSTPSQPRCIFCGKRPAEFRDAASGELRICGHCLPDPEVMDRVSEQDRVWFEEHPGATERLRLAEPGELPPSIPPHDDALRLVLVRQLEPGMRTRLSCWALVVEEVAPR